MKVYETLHLFCPTKNMNSRKKKLTINQLIKQKNPLPGEHLPEFFMPFKNCSFSLKTKQQKAFGWEEPMAYFLKMLGFWSFGIFLLTRIGIFNAHLNLNLTDATRATVFCSFFNSFFKIWLKLFFFAESKHFCACFPVLSGYKVDLFKKITSIEK